MTDTTTDTFPEERYEALLQDWAILNADDDAWTWLDNDPDVAWQVDPERESCYHARLRAIYEEAGWELCYHRSGRGLMLHYNVKLGGSAAYRGFWDGIPDHADEREVDNLARIFEESELAAWWEDLPWTLAENLGHGERGKDYKVYACGRSGGYVQVTRTLMRDGIAMLRLAQLLTRSRDYYNSRAYGEYLAERVMEEYNAERLAILAGPRPDRIEA